MTKGIAIRPRHRATPMPPCAFPRTVSLQTEKKSLRLWLNRAWLTAIYLQPNLTFHISYNLAAPTPIRTTTERIRKRITGHIGSFRS